MSKAPSQESRILEYLKSGKALTRLTAWHEVGCLETPARISELRAKGYKISTEMVPVINRFGDVVRVAEWRLQQ